MASITVLGGTGYAGGYIVEKAASRGHDVTALSRTVPTAPVDGVTYATFDLVGGVPALEGVDVVVAALSPRGSNAGALREAYAKLARAAGDADTRLIVVGGFSSLRPAPGAPRFAEGDDLPPAFADEAREMNEILTDLLNASENVDWTFVSPAAGFGAYTPEEVRGVYRSSGDVALFDDEGVSALGGEDFAGAVVDEIEKPSARRAQISFAY